MRRGQRAIVCAGTNRSFFDLLGLVLLLIEKGRFICRYKASERPSVIASAMPRVRESVSPGLKYSF